MAEKAAVARAVVARAVGVVAGEVAAVNQAVPVAAGPGVAVVGPDQVGPVAAGPVAAAGSLVDQAGPRAVVAAADHPWVPEAAAVASPAAVAREVAVAEDRAARAAAAAKVARVDPPAAAEIASIQRNLVLDNPVVRPSRHGVFFLRMPGSAGQPGLRVNWLP
jgi:hypothetical protein